MNAYTCRKQHMVTLDTNDPALFEAHMLTHDAWDRGPKISTRSKLAKPYPWTAPKHKTFDPQPGDVGSAVEWRDYSAGTGSYARERTGVVWSRGAGGTVWVTPDERQDGELFVLLTKRSGSYDQLDTCAGKACHSWRHGCARGRKAIQR